jgi:hypothetical protein
MKRIINEKIFSNIYLKKMKKIVLFVALGIASSDVFGQSDINASIGNTVVSISSVNSVLTYTADGYHWMWYRTDPIHKHRNYGTVKLQIKKNGIWVDLSLTYDISPGTTHQIPVNVSAQYLEAGSYEIRAERSMWGRDVIPVIFIVEEHHLVFHSATTVLEVMPTQPFNPGTISIASFCSGSNPPKFTTTPASGGYPPYTYKWYRWGSHPSRFYYGDHQQYLVGWGEGAEPGEISSFYDLPIATTENYTHNAQNSDCFMRVAKDSRGEKAKVIVSINSLLPISGGTIYREDGWTVDTVCHGGIPQKIISQTKASGCDGQYIYTWEKRIPGETWVTIPQATEEDYQPQILTTTTEFRRKVRNALCGTSAYSNEFSVIVVAEFNGGQVTGTEKVCSGAIMGTITETVAPSGGIGGYIYQWVDASGRESVTNADLIPNEQGKNYIPTSINNTTSANRVKYYARKVINTCGETYSNLVTSITNSDGAISYAVDYVVKTVVPEVTSGSIEFSTGEEKNEIHYSCYNVLPGKIYDAETPTGGYDGFAYKWQYAEWEGTDWGNWQEISNASEKEYIPEAITRKRKYRRMEINVCKTAPSNELTIDVYPQLQPGVIGDPSTPVQTICNSKDIPGKIISAYNASGGSGNYSYQWYKSIDNGHSWLSIGGATDKEYQPDKLEYNTQYKRNVTDLKGCGSIDTDTVAIHVYPPVEAGIIGSDQEICSGKSPATLNNISAASGGNGGFTYQWEYTVDNGITWNNANALVTGAEFTPNILSQNTVFRRLAINQCSITENGKSTASSNTVNVTVIPPIEGGTIGSDQAICFGEKPSRLNGINTVNTNVFAWYASTDKTNWDKIAGATQAYCDPSSLSQTTYFKRIATIASCGSKESNNIVTVTVTPELHPGDINKELTILSNTEAGIISGTEATGGKGSIQYQWYLRTYETDVIMTANGNGRDYTPQGNISETQKYVRKATDECVTTESNECVIRVVSSGTANGYLLPESQTICYNSVSQVITGSIPANLNSWWERSMDGDTWERARSDINNNMILIENSPMKLQIKGLKQTTYYRRTLEIMGNKIYSNVVTVEVLPADAAVTTDIQSGYCLGEPVTINVIPSVGYDYYWYAGKDTIKNRTSFTIPELLRDTIVEAMSVNRQNHCISPPIVQTIAVDRITANFSASTTDVALGKGAKFTNLSQGASTYEWFFGEGEGSYAKDLIYYFNIPGSKTIKLVATSENGCTSEKVMENYITVSNSENVGRGELPTGVETKENTSLVIYPNPVDDVLYIRYENSAPETAEIFDAKGRLLLKLKITDNPEAVNVSSLPAGAYILRLTERNNIKNIKFIKP